MFERRAGEPISLERLFLAGLALLSLAAGAVHLSAASDHREHRLVFAFFIGAAVVQFAWAGLVVQRPGRRLLLAGAALNAAIIGIWLLSRTNGVPLVAGAKEAEPLGLKDTVCALFEVLLVAGVGLLAVLPDAARRARVTADAAGRGLTAVGLAALLLAVPAAVSSAGHTHADGAHGHADAELASASGDPESSPHSHGQKSGNTSGRTSASANHEDGHDHDGPATATQAMQASTRPGGDHAHASAAGQSAHAHQAGAGAPSGGSGDHAHEGTHAPGGGGAGGHAHAAGAECVPTAAQQAAADKLVADTTANLKRWTDHLQAMTDGYVPFPPIPADWSQHYVHFGKLDDGKILDPANPESLLYAMTDTGYRPISALYILPHDDSVPPDTLGCLAYWHGHEEVFLRRPGEEKSPPMLHVFTVAMPDGPFQHEPDARAVRDLYTPFRVLVNPWYKDGCAGAPFIPGDPYQAIPSCRRTH